MGFLNKLFGPKEEPVKTNAEFWDWFTTQADAFHAVIKAQDSIEKKFINKVSPKLNQLRPGYYLLAGMSDSDTAELIITPDGAIQNVVFAEELVAAAPKIAGWKFTALKPAIPGGDVMLEMAGYTFEERKLHFQYVQDPSYPDNVAITLIHADYSERNKKEIVNGTFIFLDNYLGEYQSILNIDDVRFAASTDSNGELIPISKLKDFLIWREKEFVEKYDAVRYSSENDSYGMLKGELNNGAPLVAIVNSDLLKWDGKASHPWLATVEVKYTSRNGMPDEKTSAILDEINDAIEKDLPEAEGYLLIGRQTASGVREIYLACREFRRPSKVLDEVKRRFADRLDMEYTILKDKYWQSMERFRP